MKEVLDTLFEYKSLTRNQAKEVLINIATQKYNASQVVAFTSVYLMRSITVDELLGFRDAMLNMCTPINFDTKETIDIVGTGGDGKQTFNISTLACFVVAGAGIKVTKHGNYGVSSVSGSSNVLEKIGYTFSNAKTALQQQLDTAGVCFMHAPLFHPAMKSVAPIRKDLAVRTFFNMLGPIVNPCFPKYQLLGVYNLETLRLYNYLLQESDTNYTLVHSLDGYDEVSLTSDFKVITKNTEQLIKPKELGFDNLREIDLVGGSSIDEAAKLFINILFGNGTKAQNNVVIANAALAINCVHANKTIIECVEMAKESLQGKKAYESYKKIINA
jgi:anthranilate phosphoribosyltransferase